MPQEPSLFERAKQRLVDANDAVAKHIPEVIQKRLPSYPEALQPEPTPKYKKVSPEEQRRFRRSRRGAFEPLDKTYHEPTDFEAALIYNAGEDEGTDRSERFPRNAEDMSDWKRGQDYNARNRFSLKGIKPKR
jgi:hypothetical protein